MKRLVCLFLLVFSLISGCQSQRAASVRICPGKESVDKALEALIVHSAQAVPFKANGKCLFKYVDEKGKNEKEQFSIKMWFHPSGALRLWGDVAFNPRGLDLGINAKEFWLAAKPKEIGNCYYWGNAQEKIIFDQATIDPKILLDAFGQINLEQIEDWSLSNQYRFDILEGRNPQTAISKIMSISTCDYLIRDIKYLSDFRIIAEADLNNYTALNDNFSVPSKIKIQGRDAKANTFSFVISLDSLKNMDFTEEQMNVIFTRPEPKGFDDVFHIVDGVNIRQ